MTMTVVTLNSTYIFALGPSSIVTRNGVLLGLVTAMPTVEPLCGSVGDWTPSGSLVCRFAFRPLNGDDPKPVRTSLVRSVTVTR